MPARLILYKDNQKLGMELKDGVYRVGRVAPADVVIPDATLSSNHAELQVKASTCLVRDLGSTNGTFLNGNQIREITPVRESDELRFGGIVVRIQFPQEIKPLSDAPSATARATEKMAAAKQAAGRLSWTARYWLAGMYAVLFLTILCLFILAFDEGAGKQYRLTARYDALASQYVHVLGQEGQTSAPPPITGEGFQEPIMVADKDGRILYPLPPEGVPAKPSPLLGTKTNRVLEGAKYGLFVVPALKEKGKDDVRSYPVRSGGNLLGFVIARPGADEGGSLAGPAIMVLLAFIITLLVLTFTVRPVHRMVRGELENLRSRLSPMVNGFIDTLPRSATVPEANALAQEIEKSLGQVRSEAAGAPGTSGGKRVEYAELIPPLVDSVGVAYCFVSSDFKLLSSNREFSRIGELARASQGDSIFETGMSSIQAKQLVQAIADARNDGHSNVRIDLTHDGNPTAFEVAIRTFQDPATRSQMYGIALNRTPG